MSIEDSAILDATRQLILQLNLPRFEINEVRWQKVFPYDRLEAISGSEIVPPDMCRFRRKLFSNKPRSVILAKTMRGRLTADEWRPLIASSLIYETQEARRSRLKLALVMLPGLLTLFGASPLLAFTTQILWPSLVLIVLSVLMLIGAGLQYSQIEKSAWFHSDLKVADVASKSALVEVLRKIEAMNLEVESHRSRELPRISERIKNLLSASC